MTDTGSLTYEEHRAGYDLLSDYAEDWQGLPVALGADMPLVLNRSHPLRELYEEHQRPADVDEPDDGERVVNHWHSRRRQLEVFVVERDGKREALVLPDSPDRSMDRLTFWLQTLGASDAWDLDAEHRARDLLRSMVTDRQWRHYDLTGSFLETSPRSQVTYVFRRLRPTIALSPRGRDGSADYLRCIGVLCLHPIGYYDRTWAGCMVPTDDVVAHLTMMRADEAHYWGQANAHAASSPEAGL